MRTSKRPRVPASAAFAVFAAFAHSRLYLLFLSQVGIPKQRNIDICIGFHGQRCGAGCGAGCGGRCGAQACVGDTDEVEQERAYTSNRGQRSTLSSQA